MRRSKYFELSDLTVVPIFINCSHYCHDHTTILTDVVLRPPRFWISSSWPAFVQLPTIKEQAWRDKVVFEAQVLIDLVTSYFPYLIALNTWRSHGQYVQSRAQLVCRFTGGTHHTYDEKGRYIYFLEEIICFCIEKRINFMPVEKKSLKWQKLYSHFRCWAQVPPSSHSQSVPHYCKPSHLDFENWSGPKYHYFSWLTETK